MNRWSTEVSEGTENMTFDSTLMDTCHYTFDHLSRMYNTKGEPYGVLWVWDDCDVPM